MKFLDRTNKFFGLISVKERGNQVHISGIDGIIMRKYFKTLFETDTISKMMFTSVSDTSIVLHKFFIPDFLYMLTVFRHDPKCNWSTKRTIDRVVSGILRNTWYKVTTKPVVSMIDESRKRFLKWDAMPKQLEALHLFGDKMPRYDLRGYILAMAPGTGKSLGLNCKIRTPHGWTRMGDIKLNDKVLAPDGTTTYVTGVYPQGKLPMYKVTFDDGRFTECSDDHLWKITVKNWRPRGRTNWRVVPFKDIRLHQEIHGWDKDLRVYIPLVEPEQKVDVDLTLDPYLLGALLGDGSISKRSTLFSTGDDFLVEEISKILSTKGLTLKHQNRYDYRVVKLDPNDKGKSCPLSHDLVKLGIRGTVSHTKYIPKLYMNASSSQKLALLQGLMDTDGTVDRKTGTPSFCTTSEVLAKQIQELIRSLGGICKIATKTPTYTWKGETRTGRLAYILNIRFKDSSLLFRLPRKKALTPTNYQYKDQLKLRIRNIEYIGEKDAQCIAVAHPEHLFITDDYIVTHNTFTDLLIATCIIPVEIAEIKIIISPKKAVHLVWEKSIKAVFKTVPTHWVVGSGIKMPWDKTEYYVFNFEQLEQAIALGKHLISNGRRYFVIVDESHNFADHRAERTQKLVKLQTLNDRIYFLWASGSPILKSAVELVSFLRCSDPRFDAEAERRFKRIYSAAPGRANQIFNHRLGNMMAFVVGKSEVSSTKPTVKELPVKLPPSLSNKFLMSTVKQEMRDFVEQRLTFYAKNIKDYRDIVEHWLHYHKATLNSRAAEAEFNTYQKNLKMLMRAPDLMLTEVMADARNYERTKLLPSLPPLEKKAFRNALSAVKNIKLKVRGEALGTVLSKRRSECAAALALYCKPDIIMKESLSKTLFFASSVLPVKVLEKHLKGLGFEPLLVYAETNNNLAANIDAFTDDPNINPICATMQSLSEAVPVIAASTIVLLNRPFRQATYDQVVARADRLGQIHPVTVIEVTLDTGGEPNVSSSTDAILASVRELINEIVGSEFAGPDPEDREYEKVIDASKEDPNLLNYETELGL